MTISTIKTEYLYFYAGIILKIIFGVFLASHFLSDLFIPFVDYFVKNDFANPYAYFLNRGDKAHFPYPALMLYIMASSKILLGSIAPENHFFTLFLYRIPLLVADISIFLILKSWLKDNLSNRLIWFYWLSPVLIYISYIHGQLDVIPISLLFGSLYFLFKNKPKSSALFLGFSLAAKTNVLLVYPFFFIFLISKNISLKNFILFFTISAATFITINLPYIFDPAFIKMVFQNQEQGKLFNTIIPFNDLFFYMIPASLLILFVRSVLLTNYNKDIFIMFLGFSFGIILLFIPPVQGWYFWLIPFLAYFYIKEKGRSPLLFWGLQSLYLLYFLIAKHSDYWEIFQFISPNFSAKATIYSQLINLNIHADTLVNLVFTALQTTLLINCFWIYRKGLDSYHKHKITSSPFLVGIGGNSGVGKTALANAIANIFTPLYTTIVRGDDRHKWQRGHEKWNEFTHLNPKANDLHQEVDALKKMKMGKKIYRKYYDHNTGQFTKQHAISPSSLIIFEGLHPFYLTLQKPLYDLKIFIQPENDLMYHWKIIRDIEKRGHSKETILQSIKKREKDSKKYINTQIHKADILIEAIPSQKIKNIGDKTEIIDIYYHILLSNSVYIEPIITSLQMIDTFEISHDYTHEDLQSVILKGHCSAKEIEKISYHYITGLEDLGISHPNWPSGNFGALLLLLTYYIFEKADDSRE